MTTKSEFIDRLNSVSKSPWTDALPNLVEALMEGNTSEFVSALENLTRMAGIADKYVNEWRDKKLKELNDD